MAPLLAGLAAFAFRVLSHRGLPNDHYMHLAWAQQLLHGGLPGRDFVDPGMPLTYTLSAVAQLLWPGPFSEAVLTSAMYGAATGGTYVLLRRLTGSRWWALAGCFFEVATQPRLYSYPKVLVPVVTLLAVQWYSARPSRSRMAWLALWVVAASLLRYDLGVFAGVAVVVGLATFHWGDGAVLVRRLAPFVGTVVVGMLPYAAYVQWTEGIGEHLLAGAEFGQSDVSQLLRGVPTFGAPILRGDLSHWGLAESAVLLTYVSYLLFVLTPVVARSYARRHQRDVMATLAAGAALLACYLLFILRHPIATRVQDLASLLAILGMVACARADAVVQSLAARGRLVTASALGAVVVSAFVACAASVLVSARVYDEVLETRVLEGWGKVLDRIVWLEREGTTWPWPRYWPAGEQPEALAYVSACTAPSDRLFLDWPAPEYYIFTRRPFGGGNAYPVGPAHRSEERMIGRLSHEYVPIALLHEPLGRRFPRLRAYLRQHYRTVGRFTLRDQSEVLIAVSNDVRARGTFGSQAWPCQFDRHTSPSGEPGDASATGAASPDR